jgi:putative transcription factor
MICEMCGSDKNKLLLTEVEGALMKVCSDCARFGKGRKEEKPPPVMAGPTGGSSGGFSLQPLKKKGAYSRDVFDKMGDDELVDDYGNVIRRSREALHLSQEDLAKKINEKKSIIAKLESGNMIPSDSLVKKLEKALSVKLKEKYVAKSQTLKPKSSGPVTLGDLVKYDD